MVRTRFSMSKKNLNKIAAIEKAISEKYGKDAVTNPRSTWDQEKEKKYLQEMREFYNKNKRLNETRDKIDVNGIKVSKKLLNRESLKNCPVCGSFTRTVKDDVSLIKFECCYSCYIQYVEDREERWLKGWRPNENQ